MMYEKLFLTKKRIHYDTKYNSHKDTRKDSQICEFKGFNIIELFNTDSQESNNYLSSSLNIEDNIIELKEGKTNLEVKEITKAKLKEIEEYYISIYGITNINENCFKCLMNNFLSNELLYFSSKEDLFNYCKYCFISDKKIIYLDEELYKENKENFFFVNHSFLNNWRFFIPKTICKSCFMQLINKKDLINNIKNIFLDTENDSTCKTNYKNLALFSKPFRAAFRLNSKKKCLNKKKSKNNKNIKKIFSKINKKIIFNSAVNYDKINDIIYINKSIFNNNNNELKESNKNQKDYKFDMNNINQKKYINNIITLQGQNHINIINNININANNTINNNNLSQNYIELMIDKIKNAIFDLNKFKFLLKNFRESIILIIAFTEEVFKKIYLLLIYRALLKNTSILEEYNNLYLNFEDKTNNFCIQLEHLKQSLENAVNCVIDTYKKLNIINYDNSREKLELFSKIQTLMSLIDDNIKTFYIYNELKENFLQNFYCLISLIYEIISAV